jgi:hypothetical protein
MFKLAIIGSRDFTDFNLAEKWFLSFNLDKCSEIISGGAEGADYIGKVLAKKYNIKYTEYKADWKRYGKSAGPRRNVDIVKNSDVIFAFWDGESKGTKNSLTLARKMGKVTIIVYVK